MANRYGVLRSDGVTERALLFIDKKGILRHAHVSDIYDDRLKTTEKINEIRSQKIKCHQYFGTITKKCFL